MQFGDLVQQFFGLTRSESDFFDVFNTVAVFVGFVVAELRLDGVRTEESKCDERTWQPVEKKKKTSPLPDVGGVDSSRTVGDKYADFR
jgi:hypothetical protein